MGKRLLFLFVMLAAFVGAYAWMNDWFRTPSIQITPSVRPGRVSKINPEVYPVSFLLDGTYELTGLKVFKLDDVKNKKYPVPVWHMITDTKSKPTKTFLYGQLIEGMKPHMPKAKPEGLEPNVPYRLVIEAGKFRGEVDFKSPPAQQAGAR